MLKVLAVIFIASAVSAGAVSDVVLSGTAKDCFEANRITVPDVIVAAFDPATNQNIVGLLRAMDTVSFAENDPGAMTRFGSSYSQLINLVGTSTALARATSGAAGAFSLSFPARDSILVVGYQEVEDEPFYYGYKMVGGQANAPLALDMSRGGCSHLNPD